MPRSISIVFLQKYSEYPLEMYVSPSSRTTHLSVFHVHLVRDISAIKMDQEFRSMYIDFESVIPLGISSCFYFFTVGPRSAVLDEKIIWNLLGWHSSTGLHCCHDNGQHQFSAKPFVLKAFNIFSISIFIKTTAR
jgi:hypothetical protein